MDELNRSNEIIDDRYKITETLGEGGMAIVYKAHDLITDKDVAIKMMKSDTAASEVNRSRFEREARTAASLNHQNIVKVVNVGCYNGIHYMVNEFIDGKNLRKMLDIRGNFSFIEACDIMYELCSAVMYAHNHGVIHRDIKPQNIFLTSDGTIKLGDFGIATFQNASHVTRSETVVGSVHYLAPEITQGNPASVRSDIYSIGITFFELITGRVPYDADSPYTICNMHVKNPFPNIRKFNPKTPDCIEKIILKCVEKNPMDRYNSAEAIRKDIKKIIDNPSMLEKKESFFARLFHRNAENKAEREEKKKQKKALNDAMHQAERENDGK